MNNVTGNELLNNTFVGTDLGLSVYGPNGPPQMPGTGIKNNIFAAPIPATPGAVQLNNLLSGTNPQFVDPANHSYQLMAPSPAIAAGAVIPPYTNGYSGVAPDIGAYDHTKPAWRAGTQAAACTVSSASYGPALAPGSSAVVFGTVPFDQAASVLVTDGAGADLAANLAYVVNSPPRESCASKQTAPKVTFRSLRTIQRRASTSPIPSI